MEEILPAMGFYPEYSDGEDTDSTVTVPYLQSADITSAESTLAQLGLTYESWATAQPLPPSRPPPAPA